MLYPNLFKRILPFVLALSLGVGLAYVAGAFSPRKPLGVNVEYCKKKKRSAHFRGDWNLRAEKEKLQAEVDALKLELEDLKKQSSPKFSHHDLLDRQNVPQWEKQLNRQMEKLDKENRARAEKLKEKTRLQLRELEKGK